MVIPDLRGHGKSSDLPGPYNVETMAADVNALMPEAGFASGIVLGYSHGGAVAQQLARTNARAVSKLILTCTYAHNASTFREKLEGRMLLVLLHVMSPRTLAQIIVRPAGRGLDGGAAMDRDKVAWLRDIIGTNHSRQMRGAARELLEFDSRAWLKEISQPTLVIAGADDSAVPKHHYDTLVDGIPNATGRTVKGAGHTLLWTHTHELAEIIRQESRCAPATETA